MMKRKDGLALDFCGVFHNFYDESDGAYTDGWVSWVARSSCFFLPYFLTFLTFDWKFNCGRPGSLNSS